MAWSDARNPIFCMSDTAEILTTLKGMSMVCITAIPF